MMEWTHKCLLYLKSIHIYIFSFLDLHTFFATNRFLYTYSSLEKNSNFVKLYYTYVW